MRIRVLLGCVFLILANTFAGNKKELVIIHTNDLHSAINGTPQSHLYTPFIKDNDPTRGGFARIGTLIKNERILNQSVLVLDAGDFFMGSLFTPLEMESGFQLPMMSELGFDYCGLGTNEFEYGVKGLYTMLKNSAKKGPIPQLLLSNIKEKQDDLPYLDSLKMQHFIKPYAVVNKGGVKIGIFSLMGEEALKSAPKLKDIKFEKPIKTALKYVHFLREEKECDLVICLSHSGVAYKDGEYRGEDVTLATKVSGIDVIVSGRTHTNLVRPVVVYGTIIVQAGQKGHNIGKIVLEQNGNAWKVQQAGLVKVDDDILGITEVQQAVFERQLELERMYFQSSKLKFNSVIAEATYNLHCDSYYDPAESNLGPLAADAMRFYCQEKGVAADVTLIANGMIRDNIQKGKITIPSVFGVLSLGSGDDGIPGYPLTQTYLTASELKNLFEALYVAQKKSNSNYVYASGIRVYYNKKKWLYNKVRRIEIGNEKDGFYELDMSKTNKTLYSIVTDNYMLTFFPKVKRMTYGFLKVQVKDKDGDKVNNLSSAVVDFDTKKDGVQEGKHWLALLHYLVSFKPNKQGLPTIPNSYRKAKPALLIQ